MGTTMTNDRSNDTTRATRARRLAAAGALAALTACSVGHEAPVPTAEHGLAVEKEFLPRAARVHRGARGVETLAPMATADGAGAVEIARAFLIDEGLDPAVLAGLRAVSHAAGPSGTVHSRMEQVVDGLRVYGVAVRTAVRDGALVSVIENAMRVDTGRVASSIDEPHALTAALTHAFPDDASEHPFVEERSGTVVFAAGALLDPPTVERVWVPTLGGELEEGYVVQLWDRSNNLRHVLIGGDGRVMYVQERSAADSYRAYPFGKHADNAATAVIAGPAEGSEASPQGWVDADTTRGNNVDAALDHDGNDAADPGGRPVSATADFDAPHDTLVGPLAADNPNAAVVNAFYVVNELHDRLYAHGFVESVGNFQADNFGRGGEQGDAIVLDVQDAVDEGAANNANFATPPDGQAPRMQMYTWTLTDPARDSAFDPDILIHEVGHGVSWRLTGDMDNRYPLTGACGEGYADALAVLMTGDPVIGEYAAGDPDGIRRERYDAYTGSYGDIGDNGFAVHDDGEIIGAAFWRLQASWLAEGRSHDELLAIALEGLQFTPPRPTHDQLRDGMLAASASDEGDCLIWEAFAAYGMGEGAEGTQGCNLFFNCTASVTESFTVPAACGGGGIPTDDDGDEGDTGPGDTGPGDTDWGDTGPGDSGPGDSGSTDAGGSGGSCDDETALCTELSLPPIACEALFPDCF